MEIRQVLLKLRENNDERNEADPSTQVAELYRESLDILATVTSLEKKLARLDRTKEEAHREMEQLILDRPRWVREIEIAKEGMIHQRDLSLKDKLGIQQEVVRLEDNLHLSGPRITELRDKQSRCEKAQENARATLREAREQYNRHAEVYNREKAEADRILAKYAGRENALLKELKPANRTIYKEALRANPSDPVALMEGEVCGGCRIGLSKQQIKFINLGDRLVFCENCLRILIPAEA